MSVTLISLLFALAIAGFAFVAMTIVSRALVGYKENFHEQAKVNLAELYLFIEPEKLFILNAMTIVIATALAYFLSGKLPIAIGVFLLSALFPKFLYSFLKNRRQTIFLHALPDALGQISSALKAGLGFSQAIEGVVSVTKGPIHQEFDLFNRELRMGVDFNEALSNLYVRTPILELSLVVSCIKISRETGGNLAENLERLGETLRKKLEMEGKIDALTSQGKAQGYVMTALPLLLGFFIHQIEPEQTSLLWTTWYGWCVIALVIFLQVLGFIFIRKIVNIDV